MNDLFRSDEFLLAELSRVARQFDPPPASVLVAARTSYDLAPSWDAALAQLIYDSITDDDDSRALVRAGPGTRELTFEGPSLTVEVEIGPAGSAQTGRCRILGQLVPAGVATIEVRHPKGSLCVDADALGRFAIDDAPSGPVSLRCTPVDEAPTDTEWTLI